MGDAQRTPSAQGGKRKTKKKRRAKPPGRDNADRDEDTDRELDVFTVEEEAAMLKEAEDVLRLRASLMRITQGGDGGDPTRPTPGPQQRAPPFQ